jgi:hypothetical protein
VNITTDTTDEEDETFTVSLSSPSNAILGTSTSTTTITDNDAAPNVAINDPSGVTESASGPVNQTFTVSLSAASGKTVIVGVGTVDGSATVALSDYQPGGGAVVFNPGETSKSVTIVTLDDNIDEFQQNYTLQVFSATNAGIGDGSGLGRINDNDATPSISIADASLTEGNSGSAKMSFTITLSGLSEKNTLYDLNTSDQTATTANNDYVARLGVRGLVPVRTLTATQTVTVRGDVAVEPDETFLVTLSNLSDLTAGDLQAVGTITNDD